MYTFLHYSKCSQSREALKIMEKAGKKYVLREYVKNPLDISELQDLHEKLGWNIIDFMRTDEKEFEEAGLNINSDDRALLKAIQRFPKLLQRPIVFNEVKAIIGRPSSKILEIFKK